MEVDDLVSYLHELLLVGCHRPLGILLFWNLVTLLTIVGCMYGYITCFFFFFLPTFHFLSLLSLTWCALLLFRFYFIPSLKTSIFSWRCLS